LSQKNVSLRSTILALVIVAVISVASTYSLTSSFIAPSVVTKTVVAAGAPIKFCASMELTGNFAEDGSWVRDSYMLWADWVNSKGGLLGRPVEIIIYDDGSDPDRAVANYERCVTVDKADFLLGEFGSPLVYPTIVVSEKYKMVYISPAGGAPRIFQDRNPQYYFFAQPATSDLQIRSFFEFFDSLPADQRPKTVALSLGNDLYGEGVHARAANYSKERGMSIVYDQRLVLGQPDYTSVALAMKGTNADIVVSSGGALDMANLVKALAQVQFKPKGVWLNNGPSDPAWIKELGALAEGKFTPANWSPTAKTFQNDLFQNLYKQKYGVDAPNGAAEAWAVVQVMQAAIEATQSLDNTVIRDYIRTHSFDTIYGPGLKFDQVGRPTGDYMLGQVINGQPQIVFPTSVATANAVWPAG